MPVEHASANLRLGSRISRRKVIRTPSRHAISASCFALGRMRSYHREGGATAGFSPAVAAHGVVRRKQAESRKTAGSRRF